MNDAQFSRVLPSCSLQDMIRETDGETRTPPGHEPVAPDDGACLWTAAMGQQPDLPEHAVSALQHAFAQVQEQNESGWPALEKALEALCCLCRFSTSLDRHKVQHAVTPLIYYASLPSSLMEKCCTILAATGGQALIQEAITNNFLTGETRLRFAGTLFTQNWRYAQTLVQSFFRSGNEAGGEEAYREAIVTANALAPYLDVNLLGGILLKIDHKRSSRNLPLSGDMLFYGLFAHDESPLRIYEFPQKTQEYRIVTKQELYESIKDYRSFGSKSFEDLLESRLPAERVPIDIASDNNLEEHANWSLMSDLSAFCLKEARVALDGSNNVLPFPRS